MILGCVGGRCPPCILRIALRTPSPLRPRCPGPRKLGLMPRPVTSSLPEGRSGENKAGFVPLPHTGAGCDPAQGCGVLLGGSTAPPVSAPAGVSEPAGAPVCQMGFILQEIDLFYFFWIPGLGRSWGWMFPPVGPQAPWESGALAVQPPGCRGGTGMLSEV